MGKMLRAALVIACSHARATVALAAHPFLLVQESEYDHIRSLTSQDAWLVLESRTLRDSTGGSAPILFDPSESYASKRIDVRGLIGANSLAYILNPTNAAVYKDTLVAQMNAILTDLCRRVSRLVGLFDCPAAASRSRLPARWGTCNFGRAQMWRSR